MDKQNDNCMSAFYQDQQMLFKLLEFLLGTNKF